MTELHGHERQGSHCDDARLMQASNEEVRELRAEIAALDANNEALEKRVFLLRMNRNDLFDETVSLKAELVAEKERAAFHLALIERAEVLLRRVRPGGYLFSMDHMMADLLLKDIEKE